MAEPGSRHRKARDLILPVDDGSDRCDRCGRLIPKNRARNLVDETYHRAMRVDEKCNNVLRLMSGFREVQE